MCAIFLLPVCLTYWPRKYTTLVDPHVDNSHILVLLHFNFADFLCGNWASVNRVVIGKVLSKFTSIKFCKFNQFAKIRCTLKFNVFAVSLQTYRTDGSLNGESQIYHSLRVKHDQQDIIWLNFSMHTPTKVVKKQEIIKLLSAINLTIMLQDMI